MHGTLQSPVDGPWFCGLTTGGLFRFRVIRKSKVPVILVYWHPSERAKICSHTRRWAAAAVMHRVSLPPRWRLQLDAPLLF